MDRYPLQHDRNILHISDNVNYICHYENHVRHRHADITTSVHYSNLLGQNRIGFVRVSSFQPKFERLFDGFRVGWNRLWAGLCYLDYLYDLNAAKEHRESEYGKKHRKLW